jgi:hypothetical protein
VGAEQPDGAGVAPDVRLELTHGPAGPGVLADGRPLAVPPHASPTEVGLAAARRHAARSGRELRVEVVDGASVTLVTVGRHGAVTLLEPPATGPTAIRSTALEEPATEADRTAVYLPPVVLPPPPTTPPVRYSTPVWATPATASRPRRPLSSLVVAALVAVAVLVGAVGTGVATLSSSQSLPDSCRPVTAYAVGGQGGSSDVLRGVTDPLAKQFGEKVSVVTVPPPPAGGSFASAESDAVGSLANAMGDHVDGCPTGSLMLFGYSQGAQVAGDLASRIGTGLEPRIPAKLVQAVGLFGDPARSPRTRAVPDGTTGQGALPPRAVGFGSLDARTIEICAPGDPVCDSPTTAAAPPIEQAVASPVHGSYEKLPVASGTTAPQWAAASLGKVVAAIPTDAGPGRTPPGTAPQSGSGTTTTSEDPDAEATGTTGTGTGAADTGTGAADTGSGSAGAGTGSTSDPTSGSDTTATGSRATGDGGAATTTPPAGGTGSGTGGVYKGGGSASDSGSSAVTPTATPSGSSATGGGRDGAGAGVSTQRSGTPSSDGTDTSGSAGALSGSGSGPGSGGSGSASSGQGSAGTSYPSDRTSVSGTTGSPRTGSSGPGSAGTSDRSAAEPGTAPSTTAPSGRRSTDAGPTTTTTSAAPSSRGGGSKGTTTRGGEKTGGKSSKKVGKDTGKDTGASFSLSGGLAGFKSTPWNNQGATDPSPAPSPNVPGRQAVKFEMPGGGKRTEAEPDVPEFTEGEKAFVGYSGFFDQGFPTNTDTWQLIMQFKQPGTGSPPLAVEVGKGQLRLANDGGNEKDFCPVTSGAFSFQLGVTFGGAVDAWCNGKQTLTGYTTPKSNVQGSAYLKTGIYRDESIKQDSTLFLNDLKVGKTLESVSGLAGVGSGSGAGSTATIADPTVGGTPADQASSGSGSTAPTASAPTTAAAAGAGGSNSYFTAGAGGTTGTDPRSRPREPW